MVASNGEPTDEPEGKTNHTADGDIVIVPLIGNLAFSAVGRMSTVVAGVDAATGDHAIAVNDPCGQSKSRLTESGNASLAVEGAASIGKRGQQRAIGILRETLEAQGHVVSVRPGVDDDGEDAILVIDDRTYIPRGASLHTRGHNSRGSPPYSVDRLSGAFPSGSYFFAAKAISLRNWTTSTAPRFRFQVPARSDT